MSVSWAAQTDPGRRRSRNEDSYCARPEHGLFVVADGMGGHAGGDVASAVAVAEIAAVTAATAALGSDDTWPIPFDRARGRDENRSHAGFVAANERIAHTIADRQELRGMATTAVAVLVGAAAAVVAHVGDSRAYLFRAGMLTRLTRDHSWVEEQTAAGLLSETAAREHPWRHVVTRALSGAPDVNVEIGRITLFEGDHLLLCSDGLSSVLTDDQIGQMMSTEDTLQARCDALVGLANAGGGPDNVTVLICAVSS